MKFFLGGVTYLPPQTTVSSQAQGQTQTTESTNVTGSTITESSKEINTHIFIS